MIVPPGALHHRFAYHPPSSEQVKSNHERVRGACLLLATSLEQLIPDGREKSLAMTKVEEAMFWANAAIARNQDGAE
jgi:hypothetical protein